MSLLQSSIGRSAIKTRKNKTLRRTIVNSSTIIASEFENDKKWLRDPKNHRFLKDFLTCPIIKASTAKDMSEYIRIKLKDSTTEIHSLSALRIISSMLTFPLTTAYGLKFLFPEFDLPSNSFNISIIGARSESSLPPIYWKEFNSLFPDRPNSHHNFNIEFFGPHLMIKDLTSSWERNFFENGHNLNLLADISNRCFFHVHPNRLPLLGRSDLFFLFNPGFGSKELSSSWKPTLSLLLQSRKPIMCTAYSEKDLHQDLENLHLLGMEEDHQDLGNSIEMLIQPMANPFANLRKEQRGDEIVITNQYLYCFRYK